MPRDATTITFKLEPDLRAAFMNAAQATDRTASQLLRDFMRDFVARRDAERAEADLSRSRIEAARNGTATLVDHAEISSHLKRRQAELRTRPAKPNQ